MMCYNFNFSRFLYVVLVEVPYRNFGNGLYSVSVWFGLVWSIYIMTNLNFFYVGDNSIILSVVGGFTSNYCFVLENSVSDRKRQYSRIT